MHGKKRDLYGVLAAAVIMGCGDPTASDPVTVPPGGGNGGGGGAVTVTVGNNLFRSDRNGSTNAAVDTVVVGGKVTWTWVNSGLVPHNVASIGTPSFTSGGIKTGNGSTYEITFTEPGTYRYNCAIHGNLMTGVVVVTAPASASSVSQ